jgi:ABC-type Fe3+-hydroxamate transport system substrate-binding protein
LLPLVARSGALRCRHRLTATGLWSAASRAGAGQLALVAACAGAACGSPRSDTARVSDAPRDRGALRDDFGDSLATSAVPPHRIVSLDPAVTAMLFAMGAGGQVVGRTRWDSYPPAAQQVPSVGDALRPNIEAVLARRPDLVVLYASAENRAAAQRLRQAGVSTLALKVDRVTDLRRTLLILGSVLRDSVGAVGIADSVDATLARVRASTAGLHPVRVVWPVDMAPLRVIGGASYMNTLLEDAGADNLYRASPDPAPVVSLEDVLRRNPDVVLATPDGARALNADPRWAAWRQARGHQILVPDTALVDMPSVRMGEAATHLAQLLHPEVPKVEQSSSRESSGLAPPRELSDTPRHGVP